MNAKPSRRRRTLSVELLAFILCLPFFPARAQLAPMQPTRPASLPRGATTATAAVRQAPRPQLPPQNTEAVLQDFLDQLGKQWSAISPHISRSSVVFQRETRQRQWVIEFKTLGTSDTVTLGGISGWFTGVPHVSQDGETVYLSAANNAYNRRYIVALSAGKRPRLVAEVPRGTSSYDVSPDGKNLVYQSKAEGSGFQLYMKELESGRTKQISEADIGGAMPAFSPDGQQLAYFARRRLHIKNLATGADRIVVNDDLLKELPSWSPDGREIAYQAETGTVTGYEVYKVNLDSGQLVRLTQSNGNDVDPSFTADGRSILFTSERETTRGLPTLYLMDSNGANVRRDVAAGCPIYFPMVSLSAIVTASPGLVKSTLQGEVANATPPQAAPTPAPDNAAQSKPAVPAYTMAELMTMLQSRQPQIDKAMDGQHVFYEVRATTGVLLQAKVYGQPEILQLAELPYSSLCAPHVAPARNAIYFKFVDQAGQATHLVSLQKGQPAKDFLSLPLVPDLAFENFIVSADATRLIFDVRVEEVTTIYGYDVASGHTEPLLGEKGVGIYPALSPDLKSLAYISNGKLVVRDLSTKTDRVLVQDELVKQYPAWSADGTNIAYQATNGNPGGFDVYAVSAAGGQARRLTQTEGDDINPIFTSDGGRMLFASEGAQPGATVLSFMNADGTGRQSDPNSPKGLIFPR